MNDILSFAAKAVDKFNKDEIYTFLCGLAGGSVFFIVFHDNIFIFLNLEKNPQFLLYLTFVIFFLLGTGVVYIISLFLIFIQSIIFRFLTIRKNWEDEKEEYTRNESQVRLLTEFGQFTSSVHILGLLSGVFILLFSINDNLSNILQLPSTFLNILILGIIIFLLVIQLLITYKWLKLEKLFLMRAFVVVLDINNFLNYYGVAPQPPIGNQSADQSQSRTT